MKQAAIICIRGGGDVATGVAWRLHQCGFRVFVTESDRPVAVRRKVSFCEAVYDGRAVVEGVTGTLIQHPDECPEKWDKGDIPVLVDPGFGLAKAVSPAVVVDAILAKKNLGTSKDLAPLVIGLGPGFEAGGDVHLVVETQRGHYLGRLIHQGRAAPNTGLPGSVLGYTEERVLRSPSNGQMLAERDIGDPVQEGDIVGSVSGHKVKARIRGVIRGLIRPGIGVTEGLKIGDIDPRGIREHCFTISDKALAIAGGVLEGIMR